MRRPAKITTTRRWQAALVAAAAAIALGVVGTPQAQASPAPHTRSDSGPGKAGNARSDGDKATFDSRLGATPKARKAIERRAATVSAEPATKRLRSRLGTQGVVDIDGLTGTPRQVTRLDGFLTGPSNKAARKIALGYVRTHLDGFGLSAADVGRLQLQRDYVDIEGIHHLSWVQVADGTPLFGNGLKANVTKGGKLISVLGSPVAALDAPAAAGAKLVPTGRAAIAAARKDLGERNTAPGKADTSRAVLFQTTGGTRRAWETITMSAAHPALHVIDAVNGKVLFRQSLANDFAAKPAEPSTGKAFQYFPAAPIGGSQIDVNFTAKGWLPARAKVLSGNNTHTFADVKDNDQADHGEEIPPRTGSAWDYPLKPFHLPAVSFCDNPFPCSWNPDVPFSWQTNRNQNATQVFYYVNNWHDHLAQAPIGFTEAAGNFQAVNSSGSGEGGDPVSANTDDGANGDFDGDGTLDGLPDGGHVDNANMSTPPDGEAPTMQMFLQHTPFTSYPDEDPFSPTNVGDEADTVYHEYTHGLSNRLVVDAAGRSTLGGVQAGAMGEAWSDWYAMDYLVDQGFQQDRAVDGDVVIFQYDGEGVAVDRTEPIDCPVGSASAACHGTDGAGTGGYTYGDYGKIIGAPEVHADGEIWTQTLWDLRRVLGSQTSESLVTRAMELSPSNPSFLDERNSILEADKAVNNGRNANRIWKVFAGRGMGYFAGAVNGDDSSPVEDFSMPPGPNTPRGTLTGVVTDQDSTLPLAGAAVFFGGHASGFAGDYSAVTDAAGHYTITDIFAGTYPDVVASKAGFDMPAATPVSVSSGTTTKNFTLRRDWAAAAGGATIGDDFTGPDFSPDCGPVDAIDQSLGSGWGSTSDLGPDGQVSPDTAKFIIITLPKTIDVTEIAIDPSATCGDGASAGTAGYKVETSPDKVTWTLANEGVFGAANRGHLNTVPLIAGSTAGVGFVRFTMESPQVLTVNGPQSCNPDGGFSGCTFMDMSEIEVYGK